MLKIRKLSQFKKEMKKIVLDTAEKNAVKEELVSFMKTHPVRISKDLRQKTQNRGNIFLFLTQKHMLATLAIILTLLAGTGTAFAAENTVPGDTLYPVKIHVNEPVRSALAVSEEAQNEWDTQVAERRLDEASKLSAKGELSPEKENDLKIRILAQTDKVQKHIEELKASGKVEAASNITAHLESILSIHQEILDAIEEDSTSTPKDIVKPLLKELREEREQIHEIRDQIQEKVKEDKKENSKVNAENRMNASQNHIDEVTKFFTEKNVPATSTAMAKLEEAKTLQENGKIALDAGDFAKAFEIFGEAQRAAQKAKISMKVHEEIKFNDRVEKVLQKVEERKNDLVERRNKIEEKILDKAQDWTDATSTPSSTKQIIQEKVKEKIDERIEKNSEKQKQLEEKIKAHEEKVREELKQKTEEIKEQEQTQR